MPKGKVLHYFRRDLSVSPLNKMYYMHGGGIVDKTTVSMEYLYYKLFKKKFRLHNKAVDDIVQAMASYEPKKDFTPAKNNLILRSDGRLVLIRTISDNDMSAISVHGEGHVIHRSEKIFTL